MPPAPRFPTRPPMAPADAAPQAKTAPVGAAGWVSGGRLEPWSFATSRRAPFVVRAQNGAVQQTDASEGVANDWAIAMPLKKVKG